MSQTSKIYVFINYSAYLSEKFEFKWKKYFFNSKKSLFEVISWFIELFGYSKGKNNFKNKIKQIEQKYIKLSKKYLLVKNQKLQLIG